jgi:hypothetical protein
LGLQYRKRADVNFFHRHRELPLSKVVQSSCRCKDCTEIIRYGWFTLSEEQQDHVLEHGLNKYQREWLNMRLYPRTRPGAIGGEIAAVHWFAEALKNCPEVIPVDDKLPV